MNDRRVCVRKICALALFGSLMPVFVWGAAFERDLYFGLRSDADVTMLQRFLRDEGVYSGPITGNFFSLTQEGVKRFQKQEGIVPAAGYFGQRSRTRANELLSKKIAAPEEGTIAAILSQIKALQEKLAVLQEQARVEGATNATTTTPVPPPPPPPPVFIKKPRVEKEGFVGSGKTPLFGAKYPYRVDLGWELDKKGLEETVNCTPVAKSTTVSTSSVELYPEANTTHTCHVLVKDNGVLIASSDVTFSSPTWFSVSGYATSSFPLVVTSPFKIGEIALYNGSTTDIRLVNFETLLFDEMDSTFNRNRRVFFILRDGVSSTDTLISRTEFTFIKTPPKVGDPHRSFLTLPADLTLRLGEERIMSLWVEQLDYVRSGTLKFDATKIETTNASVVGGFSLVLTKDPPL